MSCPTDADGGCSRSWRSRRRDEAPTDWINAGTYVLEPSVLASIPPGRAVSIERETFPRILERPGRLYALRSDGYWLDIGTPAKYLEAKLDLLAGEVGPTPTPTAVERRARRLGGAGRRGRRRRGPAGAGARSVPGRTWAPSATLNRTVIGADVRIGAGARLGTRSSSTA